MSLTDVVSRMATTPLQVTRDMGGGGYGADGRPLAQTSGTAYIMAIYYPATGKELLRLPEGERTGARMVFWSQNPIYLRDVVRADNTDWQVDSVEYNERTTAYKALGRQVGP